MNQQQGMEFQGKGDLNINNFNDNHDMTDAFHMNNGEVSKIGKLFGTKSSEINNFTNFSQPLL